MISTPPRNLQHQLWPPPRNVQHQLWQVRRTFAINAWSCWFKYRPVDWWDAIVYWGLVTIMVGLVGSMALGAIYFMVNPL